MTQDAQGRYITPDETSTLAALASAARTASANGTAFNTADLDSINATLVITAASGTDELLDVVLQTTADGTNYYTAGSFPQQSGTTAGVSRVFGALGSLSRWSWTIAGTDTPTFTFSISATADRDA